MNGPLPLFPTAVIGSMPRPQYVKDLLVARTAADAWSDLQTRTDEAVRFVIGLQEQAGIDMISDGEWRRETYVECACRTLLWLRMDRAAAFLLSPGDNRDHDPPATGYRG